MSRIDSRHWKFSTCLHFQDGRHNTAKTQHCSISKVAFDLFFKPVVSGRFGRLHNHWLIIISCYYYFSSPFFLSAVAAFWKWRLVEIFQCRESIRDIITYPHIKFWWYRTLLNIYGIVAAILKMATARNFSMSGLLTG
jgi:hypothetical protein